MKYMSDCDEEVELAKAEPPIRGSELLMEILPLMEDYFVGNLALEQNAIVYRMPNGQRFRITAKVE